MSERKNMTLSHEYTLTPRLLCGKAEGGTLQLCKRQKENKRQGAIKRQVKWQASIQTLDYIDEMVKIHQTKSQWQNAFLENQS